MTPSNVARSMFLTLCQFYDEHRDYYEPAYFFYERIEEKWKIEQSKGKGEVATGTLGALASESDRLLRSENAGMCGQDGTISCSLQEATVHI